MTNDFIVCNVQTFVLHSSVEVYKNKEKVASKPCLINDIAKTAVEEAYLNSIDQIYLTGNVLYAETVQRYIREENVLNYNNKKEIKVDLI